MKKSTSKIVLIALSIALLVGAAIGFAASAETAAPEIISKNIKVNGNYCLMFAVDPATVAGDDVTITIYAETPAEGVEPVQTITKAKTATTFVSLDGDGIENDEVIVFETDGVSAKDIADALNKRLGTDVDKRKILLKDNIKAYGKHDVQIKILGDINAKFVVYVHD